MLHLTSGYGLVVEYGLALFAFVDALVSPEPAARWIPRWGWALFILVFPLCGAILWIVGGRTWRAAVRAHHASTVTAFGGTLTAVPDLPPAVESVPAPEHALADELAAINAEHERTLQLWEADLRRREAALRGDSAAA